MLILTVYTLSSLKEAPTNQHYGAETRDIWIVEHRSWKLTKTANANDGDGGGVGADEKKAADNPLFDKEAANSYGRRVERRTA